MRGLALLVEYDGTTFNGWQSQPGGNTVQDILEETVERIFGHRTSVVGSGRTDAGVHATGQVAHMHIPAKACRLPLAKVAVALNTRLPRSVRIQRAAEVPLDFHARFGARHRQYVYQIAQHATAFNYRQMWTPKYPYRNELFAEGLAAFMGRHDYTTFSKLNAETASYVCHVDECTIGEHHSGLTITIGADRFVYGMCRAIVGAAYDVARGRRTAADIRACLQQHDRALSSPLAPPHGLYLQRITYATDIF